MGVDAMFGVSDGSNGSGTDMSNLLATLDSALTASAANASGTAAPATSTESSTASSSGATSARQFAAQQTALEMEETDALLGAGSSA
jgi:hypothetical protein